MEQHDKYGKSVLGQATDNACICCGDSVITSYGMSCAQIDGTVGRTIAVEIESRTGKQVRGAVLDLLLHPYPKKLMILIPAHIGSHQVAECEFLLSRFGIAAENFRVVLLDGRGGSPCLRIDAIRTRIALLELGWKPLGA